MFHKPVIDWLVTALSTEVERRRVYYAANRRKKYASNPEPQKAASKAYYAENSEIACEKQRAYGRKELAENPERVRERGRRNYAKNPGPQLLRCKKRRLECPEKIKETARVWRAKDGAAQRRMKLISILRGRICAVLRGENKSASTMKLVGCSVEELRVHLEKQFVPGMSWENHDRFGWHIDHIIPCVEFHLQHSEEQEICFHYTNLQPLWAIENLQKGGKYFSM